MISWNRRLYGKFSYAFQLERQIPEWAQHNVVVNWPKEQCRRRNWQRVKLPSERQYNGRCKLKRFRTFFKFLSRADCWSRCRAPGRHRKHRNNRRVADIQHAQGNGGLRWHHQLLSNGLSTPLDWRCLPKPEDRPPAASKMVGGQVRPEMVRKHWAGVQQARSRSCKFRSNQFRRSQRTSVNSSKLQYYDGEAFKAQTSVNKLFSNKRFKNNFCTLQPTDEP